MKFNSFCVLCIILIIVVFLSSCAFSNTAENNKDNSVDDAAVEEETIPSEKTAHYEIPYVHAFKGDISTDINSLPMMNLTYDQYGYILDGEKFQIYSESMKYQNVPGAAHWFIDLDQFSAIGETPEGDMICVMKNDPERRILAICKRDYESVECLFRANDSILDICDYDIEEFDATLEVESGSSYLLPSSKELFMFHTDEQYSSRAGAMLDGESEYYTLTLVNKAYPALTYKINFYMNSGILTFWNEPNNTYSSIRLQLDTD